MRDERRRRGRGFRRHVKRLWIQPGRREKARTVGKRRDVLEVQRRGLETWYEGRLVGLSSRVGSYESVGRLWAKTCSVERVCWKMIIDQGQVKRVVLRDVWMFEVAGTILDVFSWDITAIFPLQLNPASQVLLSFSWGVLTPGVRTPATGRGKSGIGSKAPLSSGGIGLGVFAEWIKEAIM